MPSRRSPLLRIAIAALPAWVVFAALAFNIDWRIKVVIGAVLTTTLAAPDKGLLLTAVLAPLAYLVGELIHAANFRIDEAIVLAFLAGWLVRARNDRPGPTVPGRFVALLFAITVLASIAGSAWSLSVPGEVGRTARDVFFMYFYTTERVGLVEGARLLEGLGLVAATVYLFRRHPALAVQLPAALAVSGSVAAVASVALWFGIGFPADLTRLQQIGYRISAHVTDVNAAGSYFALMLCLGLGMLIRARGAARGAWGVAVGAATTGLWLAFSRSAIAAAAIAVAVSVAWVLTSRWSPKLRAFASVCVLVATVAIGAGRAWLLTADPQYRGTDLRQQFIATSVRMIQARPISGIGVGQYYALSPLFLTPELAWTYGYENAHNYFLQIAAELGLIGFALFVVWLAAIAMRAGSALAIEPRDWRLLGAAAGVGAFLGTSLAGHPLLVSEVAYPFWIVLGLVSALAGSLLLNEKGATPPQAAGVQWWPAPITTAAAIALVALGPLSRTGAPVAPPDSRAVTGFYDLETAEDGTPYQWTAGYASLFVPAGVKEVSLKLRAPASSPAISPLGVEVRVGGRDAVSPFAGETWTPVHLPLQEPDSRLGFTRVDLRVDRTWQPGVYVAGSGDMRVVGVQVSAPQLTR